MDLVDLNLKTLIPMVTTIVEILVDLVDLNQRLWSMVEVDKCRDPCGSRGSKWLRSLMK